MQAINDLKPLARRDLGKLNKIEVNWDKQEIKFVGEFYAKTLKFDDLKPLLGFYKE
jgi:hypothetical protein